MSDIEEDHENQNRAQRQRLNEIEPFVKEDVSIYRLQIKSLEQLMDPNVDRRRTGIYLQLLRIVSGSSSTQGKNGSSQYNYYNKSTKEKNATSFTRLFLFSDYKARTGQVVYIIESRNQNERLWMRNPLHRDNGDISVGSVILVLSPPPIKLFLGAEIPILETRGGCILMKTPSVQMEMSINYRIDNNITRSFTLNNVKVELKALFAEESRCSGAFCDRQRCIDLVRTGKACGCYSNADRLSSIVICFDLLLKHGPGYSKEINIDNFSSMRFSKLFLDKPMPLSATCSMLDNTDAHFDMEDCVDSVLHYINKKGGFTVVGWYKHGEIVDVSKDTSKQEDKVAASEITTHVVTIKPTTPERLSEVIWNEHRYRVSRLQALDGNVTE